MRHRLLVTAAVALAFSTLPGAASAEQKPLWEFGLGVGGVSFPAYPGSDAQRNYAVPVPFIVYRGEFIKADRDGVKLLRNMFHVDGVLSQSAHVVSAAKKAKLLAGSLRDLN